MALITTPLTLTSTPTFAQALALAQKRNWVCYTGTTTATWSGDKLRPSKAGVPVHGASSAKVDAKRVSFDARNVDPRHAMLAVRCGALQSGLFALDFDVHGKLGSTPGAPVLETPEENAGALLARVRADDTVMVRTPSTGLHALYTLRPGTNYRKQTNCPLLGAKRVDVIGYGQSLYFAGSSYDGRTYEHLSGTVVKEVPDWLHALLVERGLLLDEAGLAKVESRSAVAKKGAATKAAKSVAAESTTVQGHTLQAGTSAMTDDVGAEPTTPAVSPTTGKRGREHDAPTTASTAATAAPTARSEDDVADMRAVHAGIDAAHLDGYHDWVGVGFALKNSGYPCAL